MAFQLYLLLIALTYLRPFELFAPELAVFRPMLVLMVFVLLGSFIAANKNKAEGNILSPQHRKLMWGLLAVIFISVTLAAGFGPGILAVNTFLPSALLFLASALNLNTMARLRKTGAVIVMSLTVLCCMSIACFQTGFMIDTLIYKEHGSAEGEAAMVEASDVPALDTSGKYLWRVRSVGFLADPNDFAQTLVCFLPVLFAFYKPRSLIRNVLLLGPPAAAFVYTIYLTHSRGALLGLGAMFFFSIKRRIGPIFSAGLVVAVAAGAMALNFTGGRAYSANDESAGGRIDAWSEGLVMLSRYPVFGVGFQRFSDHHTHTAHNTFVVCFGEVGIVGYWVWLGLIILVYKQLNLAEALLQANSEEKKWLSHLRISMFGLFTCGLFLSRAFEPPLYFLLIFCIAAWHAACLKLAGTPAGKTLASPMPWRKNTSWFELVSIAIVWVIVVAKTLTTGRSI
jgi:putative inorganic carbon (HCO3(-)) transporter